ILLLGPFKQMSPAVPERVPLGSVASWSNQTTTVFVPSVNDICFVNLLLTTATFEVLIGTASTAAAFVTLDRKPTRALVSAEESVIKAKVAVVCEVEARSSRTPVVEPVSTPVEESLRSEVPAPRTEVV